MNIPTKPKRALIAYCALAQRLNTPGVGVLQALTPFFAEACHKLAGELFDAQKFSEEMDQQFGIQIPRLAALGLTEQLHNEGLLEVVSTNSPQRIYKYANQQYFWDAASTNALTEPQVEGILTDFAAYCAEDELLKDIDRSSLDDAFLQRLLSIDSMRILSRKEASGTVKKSAATLVLPKTSDAKDPSIRKELHLDFMTSQFLLDLQIKDRHAFEVVSDVAFANMAAEAVACFNEPSKERISLEGLTVYFDSPLLLDMLGVNVEYARYGKELLETIRANGARVAVLDHCVTEAENTISAKLASLRSGNNNFSAKFGMSSSTDLLTALAGNVGERAYARLGITLERDPEINLHRRAPTTVGTIEAKMNSRMQNWRNDEAKQHDRTSVWSMLAIRDSTIPCTRICDSKWIFLSRNTAVVSIANDAWTEWLKGTTKHSTSHIEKWAPVSMSDKQFAGYLWARTGGGQSSIPRTRLLANCSAAVRPRADIKAKAYNLVLQFHGKEEADDLAALLENREGISALMIATSGDPQDITQERLPQIIERVTLAAGEFAAERVRQESEQKLQEVNLSHLTELDQLRKEAQEAEQRQASKEIAIKTKLAQKDLEHGQLALQVQHLTRTLAEQTKARNLEEIEILERGMKCGFKCYRRMKWEITLLFTALTYSAGYFATDLPILAASLSTALTFLGFWFVPDLLDRPLSWLATKELNNHVRSKKLNITIPSVPPNFKESSWPALESMKTLLLSE